MKNKLFLGLFGVISLSLVTHAFAVDENAGSSSIPTNFTITLKTEQSTDKPVLNIEVDISRLTRKYVFEVPNANEASIGFKSWEKKKNFGKVSSLHSDPTTREIIVKEHDEKNQLVSKVAMTEKEAKMAKISFKIVDQDQKVIAYIKEMYNQSQSDDIFTIEDSGHNVVATVRKTADSHGKTHLFFMGADGEVIASMSELEKTPPSDKVPQIIKKWEISTLDQTEDSINMSILRQIAAFQSRVEYQVLKDHFASNVKIIAKWVGVGVAVTGVAYGIYYYLPASYVDSFYEWLETSDFSKTASDVFWYLPNQLSDLGSQGYWNFRQSMINFGLSKIDRWEEIAAGKSPEWASWIPGSSYFPEFVARPTAWASRTAYYNVGRFMVGNPELTFVGSSVASQGIFGTFSTIASVPYHAFFAAKSVLGSAKTFFIDVPAGLYDWYWRKQVKEVTTKVEFK